MTAGETLAYVRREGLQGLASGAMEVEAGLRLMREIWIADGCSVELAIFVGLQDEYYDHLDARGAIAADVREAAQALLADRVPRRAV
jgi:hypothetical protein